MPDSGVRAAIRLAVTRRDARTVLLLSTGLYFLVYTLATRDLSLGGSFDPAVTVARSPGELVFRRSGFLRFEPIALFEGFGLTYLFSPVNAGLALFIALLVGVNLAVSYLGITQPKACGIGSGAGLLAAGPALLSGTACCGSVLLFALGIQLTGGLLAGLQALVPITVLLLLGTLIYVGRQVDPAAAARDHKSADTDADGRSQQASR